MPASSSFHILVADDSFTFRTFIIGALTQMGHTVVCVEDGASAVDHFQRDVFDLVLLDVQMPVMDGLEATRRIKAMVENQKRLVPVIIISGEGDREGIVFGLDAGADDFLAKPLCVDVLAAKIKTHARFIDTYKRLVESETRAKAIADEVLDAIITIDRSGIILSINKATEAMFGYSPGEMIGQNVKMLMPEPDRRQHDGYLSEYLKGGAGEIIGKSGREVVGIRKDGQRLDLHLGVSCIRGKNEILFIGVLHDITQLKKDAAQIRTDAERLKQLNDAINSDIEMANEVMNRLLLKDALMDPQLRTHIQPAELFNGDLIAAARAPDGTLYLMVADATGHGLAAAISVLPTLWVFYGMARKQSMVEEIVTEMNQRLHHVLPVGRFVAAAILSVHNADHTLRYWNGGMPPAFLIDADPAKLSVLSSRHLPLGVLAPEQFDPECETIPWDSPKQLLVYSDGLPEAQARDGTMFGQERLTNVLTRHPAEAVFDALLQDVDAHLGNNVPQDDISIVNVELNC